MLFPILHWILVCFYIAAPVGAVVVDALRARKVKRTTPGGWLVGMVLTGVIVGTCVSVLYAFAVGGKVRVGQTMLCSYFAISMLLLLRGFDYLIQRGVGAALRIPRTAESPSIGLRLRALLGALARVVILFSVGLPYVMATVITYRPKVELRDDPQKQLGYRFEPVEFAATDGMRLSGWWLPAERDQERFHHETVVICHGIASNKSNQLIVARGFVPYGYNVLIFDFRGHGESAGQQTSFGDLERRDVLGAVRWIRQTHNTEARHIYGVGSSMGAAALIAAAADPSPEGRAIDAIAAYGTYGSLRDEMQYVSNDRFITPLKWIVDEFALPIASAQVGGDLANFAPAALVQELWPRPIMVVHGVDDEIIAFNCGKALFDSAQQPKKRLWIDRAGHNDIIHDDNVAERVRQFFQTAEPARII